MRWMTATWRTAKADVQFRVYRSRSSMRRGLARYVHGLKRAPVRNISKVNGYTTRVMVLRNGRKGWLLYVVFLSDPHLRKWPSCALHECWHVVCDIGEQRKYKRGGEREAGGAEGLWATYARWELTTRNRRRKRAKEKGRCRDGLNPEGSEERHP